jgi:phenylacetate-CoA ligase
MLKAFGVDGTATSPDILDEYVDSIRTLRPDLLHALPQYAHGLARHVDSTDTDIQIKMIRPSGGKFTEEMIHTVEAAFSARVRENYGTAELGTVAFDCRINRRQHLLGELFLIEFVRGGRHVGPGELGEMLITDLRNRVAPLIRYAIGDVGRYFDQPCRCGYRGLTFTVDSRLDETVVTPKGEAFSGSQVADFFLSRPEIDYVKVVQRSEDSFLAEAVPARGHERLPDSAELAEDFSRFLGQPVKLRLRTVRRLAPERNGKYKLVDSCSYKRFNGVTANG